jgi:lambda family phage portal protein
VDHRTDNVIGGGLKPRAAIREVEGYITKEQAGAWNDRLNELAVRQFEKIGRSGRQSFGEVQRLAHKSWRKVGDSLAVLSDTPQPGKPVPLQVNVVDASRCSTPYGKEADPRIRFGVESDEEGTIVAYHIRDSHPYDTTTFKATWTRFPADRVCHLYEELWPDQARGLPWCFPVITDCRDYKDFKEAVLIGAQIGACQGYIIQTDNPQVLASASQDAGGLQRMAPGSIPIVGLDTKITAFNPSQPTTTFPSFTDANLGAISAGLNYPKAWITRDRSRASFSAGKLEEIEGGIPLRADFQCVRDRLLKPTWEVFVSECILLGLVDIPIQDFNAAPWLFNRMTCVPIGRPWIDPGKEIPANVLAKEHNMTTLEIILGKLGYELDEILPQRSLEKARETLLDIVPPITSGTFIEPTDSTDGDPTAKPAGVDDE